MKTVIHAPIALPGEPNPPHLYRTFASVAQAFPEDPEYACALIVPKRKSIAHDLLLGLALLLVGQFFLWAVCKGYVFGATTTEVTQCTRSL